MNYLWLIFIAVLLVNSISANVSSASDGSFNSGEDSVEPEEAVNNMLQLEVPELDNEIVDDDIINDDADNDDAQVGDGDFMLDDSPPPFCRRPSMRGSGKASITRFYHDIRFKECRSFLWSGAGGNENNFATLAECIDVCKPAVVPTTTPSVTTTTKPARPAECLADLDRGQECEERPREIRYFYDVNKSSCRRFRYKGCYGGVNSFKSLDECQRRCLPLTRKTPPRPPTPRNPYQKVRPAFCHLPRIRGVNCKTGQQKQNPVSRWYYDPNLVECTKFTYYGCGINKNHFKTEGECKSGCILRHLDPSKEKPEDPAVIVIKDNRCKLKPDKGSKTCKERKNRFYFDEVDGKCKPFVWSGCGGNANRFQTVARCERLCINYLRWIPATQRLNPENLCINDAPYEEPEPEYDYEEE